ncbi:MAG: type III-B CRISPR module-associated Cmr3 family protein, partial [Fimbriimonadales bacterium]
ATRIERELVSGWSGAWGMPKPVQQAIAPGSVFTYTYNTSERDAVEQCLQQLTMQSIGERTAEGYGQFVACSRYHLDRDITQYNTHTGRR